jgi:homoserine kinase
VSLKKGSASEAGTQSSDVAVPGSVANLGGGFDTLGVAVQLYLRATIVDVRDDGGSRLTVVESTPPVHGQNAVERAFEAIVHRTGAVYDRQ